MPSSVEVPTGWEIPSGKQAFDQVSEVVTYLRSRGLAPTPDQSRILECLIELPVRQPSRVSVTKAASLLYMSRRTLGRQCEKAGLPSPSRILGFARILSTLRMIRATDWPIGKAANSTGWPDPFSFSNAVHRVTGLRPTVARTRGLLFVAEAWLQMELATGRLILREPQAPPCPACGRDLVSSTDRSFTAPIT